MLCLEKQNKYLYKTNITYSAFIIKQIYYKQTATTGMWEMHCTNELVHVFDMKYNLIICMLAIDCVTVYKLQSQHISDVKKPTNYIQDLFLIQKEAFKCANINNHEIK